MRYHMEFDDVWEGFTLEDPESVPESDDIQTNERAHEGLEPPSESLYEKYGNNEPYTKPENTDEFHNIGTIFEYVYRNQCPST